MRIFRGLLAVVVLGLTLEICARVDDLVRYETPFWAVSSYDSMFTVDRLGRKGRPYGRFKDYRLNSLGFRGPEVRPGGIRIVCIGASETFGLYEDPGQEYPRQLERELNQGSEPGRYQVINAGLAGQTIRTAAIRVPELTAELHPEFAVIYPTPANYIWLPWLEKAPAMQAQHAPAFEFRITDKLRDAAKRFSPPQLLDYLRKRDIENAASDFGKPMDLVSNESVEAFRSDLTKLIDRLRENHVTPVLVTHATRYGTALSERDLEQLTAWRRFYPMLKESGFLDMEIRMNQSVRKLAEQEDVPLVDGAKAVPPGDAYFGDSMHFTTRGAALLSAAVANTILRRGPSDYHAQAFPRAR